MQIAPDCHKPQAAREGSRSRVLPRRTVQRLNSECAHGRRPLRHCGARVAAPAEGRSRFHPRFMRLRCDPNAPADRNGLSINDERNEWRRQLYIRGPGSK